MYDLLLGHNVHWQDREAWVYSKNVCTRYPFQGALNGLLPDVIKECLVGALEARFGDLKAAKPAPPPKPSSNGNGVHANGNGHAAKGNGAAGLVCKVGDVKDCCGDGVLESTTPLAKSAGDPPANFEDFIYKVWGAGIAKHFAIPYSRKLWSCCGARRRRR